MPAGVGGAWALYPGHFFFEDRASAACRDAAPGAATASLQLCSLRRVKSCSPGCSRGCWKSGQSPRQSQKQSPKESPGQNHGQSLGQSPGQSPKESHRQSPGQSRRQSPGQSPRQSLQQLLQPPSKTVAQAPRSAPTATPGTPINPSGVLGWGDLRSCLNPDIPSGGKPSCLRSQRQQASAPLYPRQQGTGEVSSPPFPPQGPSIPCLTPPKDLLPWLTCPPSTFPRVMLTTGCRHTGRSSWRTR